MSGGVIACNDGPRARRKWTVYGSVAAGSLCGRALPAMANRLKMASGAGRAGPARPA
jgi:hypothetical protein